MIYINNIPEAIKFIVDQMVLDGFDLKYEYGHPKEIQQTLMEKTKSLATKDDKYPLLILFLDFEEERGQSVKKYVTEASVNMVLITATDRNYKAAERLENIFKPILWPLYEEFVYRCQMSPMFDTNEQFKIPHDKKDQYFYSADLAKEQNVFAAYLDAVEINNFEIKLQITGCVSTPTEPFIVVHVGDPVKYGAYQVVHTFNN